MNRPPAHIGMRHIAFYVTNLAACEQFYCNILGFKLDWKPDEDNIYLSSGYDNLALHRAKANADMSGDQHLDHMGICLKNKADVDAWFEFIKANNGDIRKNPKDHRDGTRSFYCADPDGNIVQLIWIPTIK